MFVKLGERVKVYWDYYRAWYKGNVVEVDNDDNTYKVGGVIGGGVIGGGAIGGRTW